MCPEGIRFQDFTEQTKGPASPEGLHCTSVAGLSDSTIAKLQKLEGDCVKSLNACVLTINGGTEDGHRTHGDHDVVDIDKDQSGLDTLQRYIKQRGTKCPNGGTAFQSNGKGSKTVDAYVLDGIHFLDEDSKHWHVKVGGRCR